MAVVFPKMSTGVRGQIMEPVVGKEGWNSMCALSVRDEGGEGRSKQMVISRTWRNTGE